MATPAPEALPTPRGAHLEMMAAVLAGDGLGRVAEIAARHAGSPVAVVVPRVGVPLEEWAPYERYVAARLAGGRQRLKRARRAPRRPLLSTASTASRLVPLASCSAGTRSTKRERFVRATRRPFRRTTTDASFVAPTTWMRTRRPCAAQCTFGRPWIQTSGPAAELPAHSGPLGRGRLPGSCFGIEFGGTG